MASENLLEDENGRNVAGGITDTGEIRMARINPITNALIVEATVTSSNTSIGSTIPGATAGSIFFAGLGGTLAQDNANLFYDDTSNFAGFGTNTPLATLHVAGSLEFDLGSDATGDTYFRNDSGFVERLPIGTAGDVLSVVGGIPTWVASSPLLSGYNTIKNQNVAVTQRSVINLSDLLTATDNAGQTDLTIDVAALAGDSTFIDALVANTYFTTTLANDSNFITELTANATFISNVSTEISGTVAVVTDGVTITGDGTVGDPLVAAGGGSSLVVSVNQTAHGLSVGDVIYCDGSNTYDKAQAISTGLVSNAVGIVTTVTDADNFIYSVIVTELTTALTGTEGAAVWLSATTAGAMTMTNPSSVNPNYLDIPVGTLLASGSKMQFNISQGSNEGLAGGSGSLSVTNVTVLDDFTNFILNTSGGSDEISGNFRSIGGFVDRSISEPNHPGITRIEESDGFNWGGFLTEGATSGLIPVANDFTFTYLARSIRPGASFDSIIGIGAGTSFDVYIRFYDGLSSTFINVWNGTGNTTTAVALPASNTWFTAVFNWTASTSTLDITVDGVSVYSGTPTFSATSINPIFGNVAGTSGTYLDVDYVKINYQVTR